MIKYDYYSHSYISSKSKDDQAQLIPNRRAKRALKKLNIEWAPVEFINSIIERTSPLIRRTLNDYPWPRREKEKRITKEIRSKPKPKRGDVRSIS